MLPRTWTDMDAAPRFQASKLTRHLIPEDPGAYAWYLDGKRMYVGNADSLRARLWKNHLGQNSSLRGSAFRRNVAEFLLDRSAADINSRRVVLTDDQLAAVRAWIMSCEVAWLTCATKADAIELETRLKAEYRPELTKR